MKLSSILVIIVTISVIITSIMLLVSDAEDKGYITFTDDPNLEVFMNATKDIQTSVNQTKTDLDELQGDPSSLDILGTMVTGGFQGLKTMSGSYNAIYALGSTSIGMMPLGAMGPVFSDTLGTIILILLFIGIVLATLLSKSDVI